MGFAYAPILPATGTPGTVFDRLDIDGVATETVRIGSESRTLLTIAPAALTALARHAVTETASYLRGSHLASLAGILADPAASANDRYVARDLLHNAVIASGTALPMCQDTGTIIIHATRPADVLTDGRDAEHLARGIHAAFAAESLRYSQLAPLSMFEEVNTGTNLPAQIDIELSAEGDYELLFIAKGGGSANKSFLFQESTAVLNEPALIDFLAERVDALGTAACPPYHLAVVIGGTSAEAALKTAKLASTHYLDAMPAQGDPVTGHGLRDRDFEERILALTRQLGYGAQFGGTYFCHDVRVIRLPRHGGSLPIALAVSCSADRQAIARIRPDGIWFERLEHDPARFLPAPEAAERGEPAAAIDLDAPMDRIRSILSGLRIGDRVSLSGTLIVARDAAHARLRARLEAGEELPAYLREHPIYYAGPAKTPEGFASGSFGPTTAARMDPYIEPFAAAGASLVTIAKGNRSPSVVEACRRYGGFYLGSVGGPAARIAAECITDIETIDMEDLGMEAVRRIRVRDFPAFLVIDDKGGDFFARTPGHVGISLGRTRTRADGTTLG